MIAKKNDPRTTPVRRSGHLTLTAILIALFLSGCAGLQPRLGFREAASGPRAAEKEPRSGRVEKPPVELSGAIEKGSIEFNFQFPLFVW